MIDENSNLEDVCYAVAEALRGMQTEAVLTGGSAATIYAPNAYTSLDADFVFMRPPDRGALEKALAAIGFRSSKTSGMFEHTKSKYTLDFPKGPLAVGGDYVRTTQTVERNGRKLQVLTPTDCVRDRLAHFFFWDDYTALTTAVAVMQSSYGGEVDFDAVRAWAQREGSKNGMDYTKKLEEFRVRSGLSSNISPTDEPTDFDPLDALAQREPYPMLSSDRITADDFFYLRFDPRIPGDIEIITRGIQAHIVDIIQSVIGTALAPVTKADGVLFRFESTKFVFNAPKDPMANEVWRARCYVSRTGHLEFRFPRDQESSTEQLLDVLAVGFAIGRRLMPLLNADSRVTGKLTYKARSDAGALAIASEAEQPLKVDLARSEFMDFAGPIILYLQRIGGRAGELDDFKDKIEKAWTRVESTPPV
jgi:hypothetical protein